MLYRKMPKTGDELSILGFGCMRLPQQDGRIDEPRAIRQIRQAVDRGVNYLDTAWPYHGGQSEPLVGKAVQDGYRARVRLATKLPTWLVNTRADMDNFLNAQLKKLGTDHIDYYLVHGINGDSWKKMLQLGVQEFLDAARQDGRIRNAGFSFHGQPEDFNPIIDAYPWIFCQIQYNYLDRDFQAGQAGLKYAAAQKIGVVIMEPLRGGNLCPPQPPQSIQALWDEAAVKRTPAEWALRWIWNHPEVTLILSGMNDEAQVEENLAIAGDALPGALTPQELALVDRVSRKYSGLIAVGCTSCGYCLPCPAGVTIPGCFEAYNNLHMFGETPEVRFRYVFRQSGVIGNGQPGFASQCVNCGACLEKCPQHIAIPDVLKKVAEKLEGADIEERIAAVRSIFKKEHPSA